MKTVKIPSSYKKLQQVRETLHAAVYEREAETDGILLTAISGTSCLFLGDVGTAKTYHLRLASQLLGLSLFDTLISESTKPDHIFGPTDVPALAKGKQRTKIEGYAPTAEIVFFDEIFKASGVVLNPLLWLVNERQYRNGDDGVIQTPISAVFAASNELPTDPGLRAIYDRMLLRYQVSYMKNSSNLLKMASAHITRSARKEAVTPLLTSGEMKELRDATWDVGVPDEVQHIVVRTRDQVELTCGTKISDRRMAHAMHLLQSNALLQGRDVADPKDTEVLANLFWDKTEHITKVRAIALAHATAGVSDLLSYAELADSVWETAQGNGDVAKAATKLEGLYATVQKFNSQTGKYIAEQIQDKLQRARAILEQRAAFTVLKIEEDAHNTWYKLPVLTAASWTPDLLRSAGFHWYNKGAYWWREGKQDTDVITEVQKHLPGARVTIQKIGET